MIKHILQQVYSMHSDKFYYCTPLSQTFTDKIFNYPVHSSLICLQGFLNLTGCTEVRNIGASESKVWTSNESWRVGHQAHIQPTKHEQVCYILIVLVVSCLGSKTQLDDSSQMLILWMSNLLFQRKPRPFSALIHFWAEDYVIKTVSIRSGRI